MLKLPEDFLRPASPAEIEDRTRAAGPTWSVPADLVAGRSDRPEAGDHARMAMRGHRGRQGGGQVQGARANGATAGWRGAPAARKRRGPPRSLNGTATTAFLWPFFAFSISPSA